MSKTVGERIWTAVALITGAAMLIVFMLGSCGCSSPKGQMSHAVFTAAVTIGEQIAVDTHPESIPYLRVAVPVVCSVANRTNVSPQAIVAALDSANITNRTTRLIINSSLTLFNVVVSGVATNQSEVQLYAQDLCNGMTAGLPPDGGRERAFARRSPKPLPPHLR